MGADPEVVIAGAGPVGLAAALALSRRGLSSQVFEGRATLNTASKASTFHPPTLEIMAEFGVLEAMLSNGCMADRIQYRRTSGVVFAAFDQGLLSADTSCPFRIHLEQAAITPLLASAAQESGLCTITFDAPVVDAGTQGDQAFVRLQDGRVVNAPYVIGADGAHSVVRQSAGIGFSGSQYPGRVLRLIVSDDLEAFLPGVAPVSYLFAEDDRSISLLKMNDCWRVIIRVPEGLSDATVSNPQWYGPIVSEFITGGEAQLSVIGSDIYSASKMIAERFQDGRILLAGDAAHLTNTRGGMNMNCGIHDAYALARAMASGDASVVAKAAAERHRVARDDLLPRTDRNVSGRRDWLDFITQTAADATQARAYLLTSAMLDMAPPRDLPANAAVRSA